MNWIEKWAGKNKAKCTSFRQQLHPPDNNFELNFVLEAADLRVAIQDSPSDRCSVYTTSLNTRRQRSIAFSLAKVVDKQGSRICLRHLGTDDRNDIWLMIDSDMIRPYPSGSELSVPFGFMNSHSVWNKIITRVDKEEKLAPKEWFPPHPKDPGSNQFKVGEKVEAVDRRNAQLICPATISEIKGNFVLVSFDGWSGTFDYWASYNSQDLFPVGWCGKAKHKLQQPGPYYEVGGKPRTEFIEEYSVPAHTHKSIKRKQTVPQEKPKKRKSIKQTEKITKTVKNIKKPTPTATTTDYDSDCTHLCVNDDDTKIKKRKLSNSSPIHDTETISKTDVTIKSKSKSFRNLFKMWTEKTAMKTKHESFEEGEPRENYFSEVEKIKEIEDKDPSRADNDNVSKRYTDELSDCVSEGVVSKSSCVSPEVSSDQLNLSKPPVSPSVTNSIMGDYKYLSETSGTSCCAKSDELSSMVVSSPTDATKRVSSITNLPSDPHQWTIDDVQTYLINKNPSLETVAQEFRNHEIDGQALLLLTMGTLRQYMKVKLGPAIKVDNIVRSLLDGKQ